METKTIQTLEKPVAAMVVESGPWLGSVTGRVAYGLARAYYHGQFEMRIKDQEWLDKYTDARVGSVGAVKFAERRARENAGYFWSHWMDEANDLLPNGRDEGRAGIAIPKAL